MQHKKSRMRFIQTCSKVLTCSLLVLAFSSHRANAQFKIGDALKKAKDVVGKAGPEPWKPGSAITTSIRDTLYGFSWMTDEYLLAEEADSISSFELKPGYYKARIR